MKKSLKLLEVKIVEKENELNYANFLIAEFRTEISIHNQNDSVINCCNLRLYCCEVYVKIKKNIFEGTIQKQKIKKELKNLKNKKYLYFKNNVV